MRLVKYTVSALVLCAAFAATGASADQQQENSSTCVAAAKQISTALDSTAQQNADEARLEQRRGMEFCNAGLYHMGMVHYTKALELLNAKG